MIGVRWKILGLITGEIRGVRAASSCWDLLLDSLSWEQSELLHVSVEMEMDSRLNISFENFCIFLSSVPKLFGIFIFKTFDPL